MHTKMEDAKIQLLDEAAALASQRKGRGVVDAPTTRRLLDTYYRHADPEDLLDRSAVDVYGATMSHYRLALSRPQGTASVHVFTPSVDNNG